ncbi:MAG: response regulator transcription factor [Rhodobacteraceae bacterium]|nr:response regulator transcription factor [Paracoccaceae bacterium]
MRILLVEDAQDVADPVIAWFSKKGDALDHAPDLETAHGFLAVQAYDALILDINLPDGEGTELLTALRKRADPTPVLMLTARLNVDDRVSALDHGADDYVVKPFDLRELDSRLRAVTRRAMRDPAASSIVNFGGLEVDMASRSAMASGVPLELTRREFALLEILIARRGRVVAKQTIFESMFSIDETDIGINAVETYVGRLRRKMAGSGVEVRTLRGLGYQLVALPDASA